MAEKQYVIAVKRDRAASAPADWQDQFAEIEGVSLLGATQGRAQFVAQPDAAEQVRNALGDDFHIEEVGDRNPL